MLRSLSVKGAGSCLSERSGECILINNFFLLIFLMVLGMRTSAQAVVNTTGFHHSNAVSVNSKDNKLTVDWPTGNKEKGRLIINLKKDEALFSSIQLMKGKRISHILKDADPAFLLTTGKRDLISQNGWNIFFDKVPLKPHQSYIVKLNKQAVAVTSNGNRTIIKVAEIRAASFAGNIEITLYNGSPLFNIAAVMATDIDSTAILYDAGLISRKKNWDNIYWSDVYDSMQSAACNFSDTSINQQVKYRTIIGGSASGSMAVFPAPHQYFYPLDEAFNLNFTWYGNQYNKMFDGYGIGIRQDLYGDNRYVPWFNAPPKTMQRLNFFCYISTAKPAALLNKIKAFTHNDTYLPLDGYKTMASHFHNEYVMKVILAGKPVADTPNFVKVFKTAGINIVHLAEFHYTAHPKGPDEQRLNELKALFAMCSRFSGGNFLLLPGEEPNEFFGGHWLQFFPKPVYWIMSRKEGQPFVTDDPVYGKIYRIATSKEMLDLLEKENGLAWTAHARTKGSTGFPDTYKEEKFFLSDRFLGAAWKAMPADLSLPRLGKRVLDLMDDMNNWGLKKKVLSEADLFSIEPENEMYAHMNVNYLQLKQMPLYKNGWQPVLDVLQKGSFFSTTGEVLIPAFSVNGKTTGETLQLTKTGKAVVSFNVRWTFPLNFAEIISGDGSKVYRNKVDLNKTLSFGEKSISETIDLTGRKWVRLEVWDIAANGAFTQTVWLK
ncbi:MAG: hypothetical protein ABJC98_18395 [Bacteroidota bacterium]